MITTSYMYKSINLNVASLVEVVNKLCWSCLFLACSKWFGATCDKVYGIIIVILTSLVQPRYNKNVTRLKKQDWTNDVLSRLYWP